MEQGLQVLKIFKDHISKQCILDDFEFYEDRQKRIQDKKAKQQLFQKQVNCLLSCEFEKEYDGVLSFRHLAVLNVFIIWISF